MIDCRRRIWRYRRTGDSGLASALSKMSWASRIPLRVVISVGRRCLVFARAIHVRSALKSSGANLPRQLARSGAILRSAISISSPIFLDGADRADAPGHVSMSRARGRYLRSFVNHGPASRLLWPDLCSPSWPNELGKVHRKPVAKRRSRFGKSGQMSSRSVSIRNAPIGCHGHAALSKPASEPENPSISDSGSRNFAFRREAR